MTTRTQEEIASPIRDSDIPPEIKRFDKPLGLEDYWFHRIWTTSAHLFAFYFLLYLIPMGYIKLSTVIVGSVFGYMTGFGSNLGTHRYWTHKTFKATRKLEVLLMLLQTAGFQMPIFTWCRIHRTHHKFTDTDADPHNAQRGFWFSHIGWLVMKKKPEVEEGLKVIDVSDLAKDPVVRFQAKYYWELILVTFFILPMTGLHWLQPELTFWQLHAGNMLRYVVSLHFTFSINSLAHKWGNKPYDKNIAATENILVSILASGEGWHNYHHAFPWDYKTSEFAYKLNVSTFLIHFFAWLGWAYDLKTVSKNHLVARINRTGDGTHPLHVSKNVDWSEGHENKDPVWGWGDKVLKKEDLDITETVFRKGNRG